MEDENKYAEDIELEDGDTRQMYEHFKFVADKGQELLRIDKFLVARTGNHIAQSYTTGRRCRLHIGKRAAGQVELSGQAPRCRVHCHGPASL